MKPEECLIGMKGYNEKYTLDDAILMLAYCTDRGLTPFYEVYPVLTDYTNKKGVKVRQVSFKEHYSVLQRWAQQSGGYSAPVRKTEPGTGTDQYGATVPGIIGTVSVITNRDYTALIKLAQIVPGFNFTEERAAFLHTGTAFVPNSHYPPAGKDLRWVALKRAEEEALRRAFGREPMHARDMYAGALTASASTDARTALYGGAQQAALPVPVDVQDADFTVEEETAPAHAHTGGMAAIEAAEAARKARNINAFPSAAAAVKWGFEQGAFNAIQHAQHAYDKLKAEAQPKDAEEMGTLWRADVARRLDELNAVADPVTPGDFAEEDASGG